MKTKLMAFCALMMGMTLHAGETLTYSDLVERMYDMKRLTTQPEKGEKSGSFSSWYQTAGTEDYYKAVPPSERSNYFIPATSKSDEEEN